MTAFLCSACPPERPAPARRAVSGVEESEYVGEFQLPSLALSVSSVLPSSCRLNLTRDPVLEMLDHITSLLDDFERYWMILH